MFNFTCDSILKYTTCNNDNACDTKYCVLIILHGDNIIIIAIMHQNYFLFGYFLKFKRPCETWTYIL